MKKEKIYKLKIRHSGEKSKKDVFEALNMLIKLEDIYEKEKTSENYLDNY